VAVLTSAATFERKFMKLEKQVCSLELAKRLKELVAPQWSALYWVGGTKGYVLADSDKGHRSGIGDRDFYSAFTVAELGEIIRKSTSSGFDFGVVMSDSAANGFRIWLADTEGDDFPWTFDDESTFIEESEAEARAKMLIYLVKNNLINFA
jgi:hypothetical protein